ncbi:MAG: HlyD family secretion protein [Bacteroidota bacterium]
MRYDKWIFLLAGLVLLSSAACAPQAPATPAPTPVASSGVIAEGHIYPAKYTTLSFLAPGVVKEVNVAIGDKVQEGDVLIRLANADQAEAQVVSARQAYDLLLRDASGDHARAWQAYMDAQKVREAAQEKWNDINLRDIENRIEDRTQDLQDRQVDLDKAKAKFEKYKDRGRDDANYKNAEDGLDHAQSDYDKALKDLESTMRERDVPRANLDAALAAEAEAKRQYELGLDGPNADQLALLKAQLSAAEGALSNYVITAPFSGVVMDLNASVGDEMSPGVYAIKLADTSDWYVKTSDLTELEVVRVRMGQAAGVVPDALPDVSMTGKVTRINQAAVEQGGDMLYQVELKLDSLDPRLLWGMTVEVTFEPED